MGQQAYAKRLDALNRSTFKPFMAQLISLMATPWG